MVAGVDGDDGAGDAAGKAAAQVEGGVADFPVGDVSLKGGLLGVDAAHVAEAGDSASGQGLQRACVDGVDADVSRAVLRRELPDFVLQSGLGDAHDVVAGVDALGGVEGHGDDAAAVGHEGRGAANEGDEGVGADFEGVSKSFAAQVGEVAAKVVAAGEGDAVDEVVDGSEFFARLLEDGVDFAIGGDVALEEEGVGDVFDEAFGTAVESLVLVDDAEAGAGAVEGLADGPGDAAVVGDAEDEGVLAGRGLWGARVSPFGGWGWRV